MNTYTAVDFCLEMCDPDFLDDISIIARELRTLKSENKQKIALIEKFYKEKDNLSILDRAKYEYEIASCTANSNKSKAEAVSLAINENNSALLESLLKILDKESERVNACLRGKL